MSAEARREGAAASAGRRQRHLVVIDAYDGFLEHLSDDGSERTGAAGLGLPLAEIAEALDCRITRLHWDDWHRSEARHDSYVRWMPFPAARPTGEAGQEAADPFAGSVRVKSRAIPAQDPEFGRPFENGLSPRTYGLLADSDPLFLASYVLNQTLGTLVAEDRPDAVILPMFGGPGYVAQMSRATGAGLAGLPFGVVATGRSAERQLANGEGLWTRPAITRRQMEDLSLALADLVLVFGPMARARVAAAQPDARIVEAPRRVAQETLDRIAEAARTEATEGAVQFFLSEPLDGASGALVLLDAVRSLRRDDRAPARPVSVSGSDMRFPPNLPRDFRGYWSGRGWVGELVDAGYWSWDAGRPDTGNGYPVRLYPSAFEHLPDVWSELARGTAVLLSPEAAEGLAPGQDLPPETLIGPKPDAEALAARLADLGSGGTAAIESARRRLCEAVVAAHRGPARADRLAGTVGALSDLMDGACASPRLDGAALRLLDARPGAARPAAPPRAAVAEDGPPTLAVAVACYEMGNLVVETVESIWQSSRVPDELLLIDDGSRGEPTRAAITLLERAAEERGLPLRVIRQRNQGLAPARNRALAETGARYISFLDGDDLIGGEFYRLALDTLSANPGLGGVAAWAETFGDGVPPGFWNAPQPEFPLLLAENTVFVPLMMPVALLRRLGGYDVRQRYNYEDWELPVRLLEAGYPIVTIPRYLQRYRVRADSLLRTMSDVQNQVMREEMFRNHRPLIERFGPELSALIENRLMRVLGRPKDTHISGPDALKALKGHARAAVGRAARRIGWRLRGGDGG